MKKLLLLLMAVLLFAPPRANAATEKTLNFFVTKNSTPWTVTNDTYSANGVGFMYVDIFSSNTATAVTTGSNSAIHNNNISSTVYIKNIEIKNHATCSHNHTQAAWKNFPTNNFPITVTAIKRNDGNSTSGKLVYTAGSSSKANQITLNRETGLNFAIQYGKITKVEIEFKSAVANALVACEGTVRQLPSDDTATATSYVFVPADNSKIVSIANTAATATQPIGLIKISYEEGTPPVPANPTVEDLKLVCDVKYGYAIEGNSIYVTGEPVSGNYGLWTKAIKDIIAGTAIEDATGLAYTFKDLTKPTDITGIKAVGTGNPINEWVKITNQVDSVGISFKELINKTNEQIGTNQSYYLGLIKFVAFNKDLASDPLVLNVYIKRLPAPEIDLEKTCAVNGQSFNTSTNELTYEKGNPTIYFKSMANYLNWGNIQAEYSIDDDTNWTTCKLENKTDEPKITISNWNNNPPYVKNGTANDIKLRVKFTSNNASGRYDYYDENYGKTQPYVLIKTRSISNNVSSLTAPTISVTGKTVDLEGGVKGYLTLPTVSATMAKVEGEVNGTLQFQVSTTTPPAQVPDDNGWTNYTIQAFNQQVSDGFTGRIFFHEYKSGFNSSYSHVDLSKVSGTALTDISYGTLTDAAVGTPVSEGTAVTINGPLYVRGVYESNSPTASGKTGYVLFVTDKDGNAMRVNGEYTKGHAFNGIDFSGKNPVLASVTGVLTGQNKGFPELTLTTPAIDYTALLTAPIEGGDAAPEAETTFSLEKKDFSKLMLFTNFTYKGDDTFADRDGNLVKIYHRLGSSSDWDEITNYLDENVTYRVLGYVGYAPEGLVIMPLDAVPGLRLLAPNPINPEAAPGEFIEMNVISEKLTLTANLDGVDDEGSKVAKIQYVFTSQDLNKDNFQSWVDGIDWTQSPAISQSATDPIEVSKDQLSQGGCILAARLVGNSGLASGIVTVRFNKIDVPADNHLGTIAEFKAKYGDDVDTPKPGELTAADYYQFTGKAQVREVTPTYLYVRDLPEEGKEFTEDELSSHSIIIYNADGWDSEVAMESGEDAASTFSADDTGARKLEKGDIITNFAMIADRTSLNNLRVNATGFARTFRRVEGEYVSYEPAVKNAQGDIKPFGESDRMLRYTVKAVQISRSGAGSEADPYVYTLEMPGNPEINNGGVFKELTGWDEAWDATKLYDVNGVVIRNGDKDNYAIAITEMPVPNGVEQVAAPEINLTGAGINDADMSFLTEAYVEITYTPSAAASSHTVYYTKDGSDPRYYGVKYTDPIYVDANTVIKAYVVAAGAPNSEVTEAYLTRTSVESRYVINFILNSQKSVPYHFIGDVRVAAKGGDYLFVRGTQGHYLPINIENNAIDLSAVRENDYISDMVITPHIVGDIVRGAHITSEYGPLFKGSSPIRPSGLTEDIEIVPDSVTELTVDNARRFVKLSGVTLTGFKIEAEGTDAQAADQWILKQGDGKRVKVDHTVLKPEFDFETIKPNARYNVTGFAMLTADGKDIELWPTKVEEIRTTTSVNAVFTGNLLNDPQKVDNSYEVEFYPYTTVELNVPGVGDATIYYYIAPDDRSLDDDSKVQWNVYAQPFAVTKSCYIHAKAVRPGYGESVHTHIDFTLAQPAGTVDFDVDPQPGKTIVTMSAAAGAEIYWTKDNTLDVGDWTEYTGPVKFTQATRIWACAKEGGNTGTPVTMHVLIQPGNGISGSLVITHRFEGEIPMVTIQPEDELAEGTYTIYYTTDGTTPTVNSTVYDGEFAMPKEGGVVLAILKENAKEYPGEVAQYTISYVPTGIEGVDSDRDGSESVRAEGDSIIAPEGSEVYDITGRRVATTGLRSGIYIVKVPGANAVKVKVD